MSSLSISVAMCTFNGERFVGAQLESIAAQDRPPDELVVCDDGSTDGTRDIVNTFATHAPFPVRVVVNDKNLGSTRNFERAISLCRGDIVALADQDDVWYAHKLQRLENAFLQSDATVAAFSDADLIDDDSLPLNLCLWPTFSFDRKRQRDFAEGKALSVLVNRPVVTGAALAFRRECFDAMTPIPPNQIHDRWMSFLLASRGRVELIPERLMQYRRHQGQQMGTGAITVQEKTALIGARGASHYLEEIHHFRQLYDRLEERKASFVLAGFAQKEIKKKIFHLEHRAELANKRVKRLPKVLREVLNGNYRRYSGGWRSAARDLLLP